MTAAQAYNFLVIGAGSAGCAVAAGLSRDGDSVAVIEAGPSDNHPLVKMPFGLIWLMGSARDWQFKSAPMAGLKGRQINIPRGRMVGGSGSINSMVWFRGRAADFDDWGVPGWGWTDVAPAFEAVEAQTTPDTLDNPHPMVAKLGATFGANRPEAPTPERASGGVFRYNMRRGRRWSAADAFLRPARGVTVLTGRQVQRLVTEQSRATGVEMSDGQTIAARRGVVLSAGSIGSPAILLQSGIGPAADLARAGIPLVRDVPGVGANLHDHPGVGLHFAGPHSGYGVSWRHALAWASAPLRYALGGRGIFNSPTVEGGMFFGADADGAPQFQSHFIPFFMNPAGSRYTPGEGYFADVCLCRPTSRGALRMTPDGLSIDLGLFSDPRDLDQMVAGITELRRLLAATPLEPHRAPEVKPGPHVAGADELRAFVQDNAGTAYHPVGTLRMGADAAAPVDPRLAFRGMDGLWVADASVMPAITSANTNAPSMMIGHRAGQMIREDTR